MADVIPRPLWRGYASDELPPAIQHAHAGGIAVLKARSWRLLGASGSHPNDLPLYVDWAIRAVEAPTWKEETTGALQGLVTCRIGRHWRRRVDEWIERDSAFVGAVDNRIFDCVLCGACCHDNNVLLSPEDLLRFQRGGRPDLGSNVRRQKGRKLLPLTGPQNACVHLDNLQCSIYLLRPDMCREFPAGSEHCITSREEVYGSPFPAGF